MMASLSAAPPTPSTPPTTGSGLSTAVITGDRRGVAGSFISATSLPSRPAVSALIHGPPRGFSHRRPALADYGQPDLQRERREPIRATLSLIHISEPTRRTPISYA